MPPPDSKEPFKVVHSLENKVVRADSFLKFPLTFYPKTAYKHTIGIQ